MKTVFTKRRYVYQLVVRRRKVGHGIQVSLSLSNETNRRWQVTYVLSERGEGVRCEWEIRTQRWFWETEHILCIVWRICSSDINIMKGWVWPVKICSPFHFESPNKNSLWKIGFKISEATWMVYHTRQRTECCLRGYMDIWGYRSCVVIWKDYFKKVLSAYMKVSAEAKMHNF